MTDPDTLAAWLRQRRSDLLAELADVDAALRRVDAGCYGLCAKCGQAIDAARLLAVPATSWCRACKHDYELRRGIVDAGEAAPPSWPRAVGDS